MPLFRPTHSSGVDPQRNEQDQVSLKDPHKTEERERPEGTVHATVPFQLSPSGFFLQGRQWEWNFHARISEFHLKQRLLISLSR